MHRVNALSTQLRSISRFSSSIHVLPHFKGKLLCWLLTPLALLAFEFSIDGITWKVFWVCTLLLSIVCETHLWCVWSVVVYSDPWIWFYSVNMHSAVDGHLVCFHFRAIVYSAAMNILLWVCWWTCGGRSLCWCKCREQCLALDHSARQFSKW